MKAPPTKATIPTRGDLMALLNLELAIHAAANNILRDHEARLKRLEGKP